MGRHVKKGWDITIKPTGYYDLLGHKLGMSDLKYIVRSPRDKKNKRECVLYLTVNGAKRFTVKELYK
jgi:hypothetical protein